MVRRTPSDGFLYILQQVDITIANVFNEEPPFRIDSYVKNSNSFLRFDAVFTVVEAALKGFMKWLNGFGNEAESEDVRQIIDMPNRANNMM